VQEDEGGKQLGEFLKVGRPDRGMPPFPNLTEAQNADIAAFYHSEIFSAANRFFYKVGDVLVGDAKAGEAFFSGVGKCTACHSAAGDLKGVGGKYDPPTLQVRMLNPRVPTGRRGPGGPGRGGSGPPPKNLVQATVTLPGGQKASGILLRLTDFDVTIIDPATGERRSWLRKDDVPAVAVTDPLQAHVDLWSQLTDEQMHNLTAYLASLK
jgi:mono/diheme cytochrome c family protein